MASFDDIIKTATESEIAKVILACYDSKGTNVPRLFDGRRQPYDHHKACYYFFSWLIRDMPAQRLRPLISQVVKNSHQTRIAIEVEVLASLIAHHRTEAQNFSWEAIREVMMDRLEGSRRSLKGLEKEVVARDALSQALQIYFDKHTNYGIYADIKLSDTAIKVAGESFDVHLALLNAQGQTSRVVLMSVKTRETEGGGHAYLFSRDVQSAIGTILSGYYIVMVIVAQNWSSDKLITLREKTDFLSIFETNPNEFSKFNESEQEHLNQFIAAVLDGLVLPKAEH